ncbi:MAG: hypothetical protein QW112_02505 [Candidatus Micrarchaeia archaeon]
MGDKMEMQFTDFTDLEKWILCYLTGRNHCGMLHVTTRTVALKAPPELVAGMDEQKIEQVLDGLYRRGLLKPGGTEISAEYYKPLETFLLSEKGMRLFEQMKNCDF